MKSWIVMVVCSLTLLGILLWTLAEVRSEREAATLPLTNLDMVRVSEYPGYGKVALFRHIDGTCVLIAPGAVEVGIPKNWCE